MTGIGALSPRRRAITREKEERKIKKTNKEGFKNKFKEQSPLKIMGYDTLKSDADRWWVLSERAVPRLGKEKVIFYLEMFIKMGENNPQMQSAVSRWKYDLDLVKNYAE